MLLIQPSFTSFENYWPRNSPRLLPFRRLLNASYRRPSDWTQRLVSPSELRVTYILGICYLFAFDPCHISMGRVIIPISNSGSATNLPFNSTKPNSSTLCIQIPRPPRQIPMLTRLTSAYLRFSLAPPDKHQSLPVIPEIFAFLQLSVPPIVVRCFQSLFLTYFIAVRPT